MRYSVKYGVDSVNRERECAPTICQIRTDENIHAALGFGDNVHLLIGGVAQPDDVVIPDGAVVVVETAANKKA
jgi:hypothetical protein